MNILQNSPIIIGEKLSYFLNLGKSLCLLNNIVTKSHDSGKNVGGLWKNVRGLGLREEY